ncbi:MAG: hypothetical protein IPH53_20205 [Flavobacteriales bacterium]|nr:hypothetical protein [Flavobacteriales bacterium]
MQVARMSRGGPRTLCNKLAEIWLALEWNSTLVRTRSWRCSQRTPLWWQCSWA